MKISSVLNPVSDVHSSIKQGVIKICGKNSYAKLITGSIMAAGVGLLAAAIALVALGIFASFPLLFTAALILFTGAALCLIGAPVAYAVKDRQFFSLHDM